MRLLLINWQDRLNPQAGGAEAHLHEIFGRLVTRGHEITFLVSGWPGAATVDSVDGLEVHRTGGRHSFSVAAPRYYRRHLRRRPFEVVVEALNKVPVFSPTWAGRQTMLIVHHLFGATAFREASVPVAAATWLLERPLSRVYRGIPVEAISASTAADLVDRGLRAEDIRVIHPGVDLQFFTPDPSPLRSDEPTFLYLGRVKRYKGVELVLHALARLSREGIRARLIVAGRGKHLDSLRSLARDLEIADRVEFPGFVTEEQKRDLFRAAWANVFPSPKEGWGITNLEAAACATPTIASDSPGLRESVRDGETGVLVPHGDVAALTRAMRRLAQNAGEVGRLGEGARRFALQFSWDRAALETETHLLEVIQSGSSPHR